MVCAKYDRKKRRRKYNVIYLLNVILVLSIYDNYIFLLRLYIIKHKSNKTKQNFSKYLNKLAKAIERIFFSLAGCEINFIYRH